jgi:hypothetical protein
MRDDRDSVLISDSSNCLICRKSTRNGLEYPESDHVSVSRRYLDPREDHNLIVRIPREDIMISYS